MITEEVVKQIRELRASHAIASQQLQKKISSLMLEQGQLSKNLSSMLHRSISDDDFDIAEKIAEQKAEEMCLEFDGDSEVTESGIIFTMDNPLEFKEKIVVTFEEINNYQGD